MLEPLHTQHSIAYIFTIMAKQSPSSVLNDPIGSWQLQDSKAVGLLLSYLNSTGSLDFEADSLYTRSHI